ERLMRRYAAEGGAAGLSACARLLAAAPASGRGRLLAAMDQGFQERPARPRPKMGTLFNEFAAVAKDQKQGDVKPQRIPPEVARQLESLWTADTKDVALIRVCIRLGWAPAKARALRLATDAKESQSTRLALLDVLADVCDAECVEPLLKFIGSSEAEAVQVATIAVLQRCEHAEIATALTGRYQSLSPKLRTRVREVLLSRQSWAKAFLQEVDRGHVDAKEVPVEQLRVVSLHADRSLDDLVRKHWGNIQPGTPEEKLAEMRRVSNDLRAGAGDPAVGRTLFRKHCATCHKFFGEGESIGPELTHANRKDRDELLRQIIDPSAVIRK